MNYNIVSSTNMIPVCVLEVLKKHSDASHLLTQDQIADLICREFSTDIVRDRKAIGNAISKLRDEIGYDIVSTRRGSYYNGHPLAAGELKMVNDMIMSNPSVDSKQAASICDRLNEQCSIHGRKGLMNGTEYSSFHTGNHSLFYNLEICRDAMDKCSAVSFDTYAYRIGGFTKTGKTSMIPRKLTMTDGRYFVSGIDTETEKEVSYPLDHVSNMRFVKGERTVVRSTGSTGTERFVVILDSEDLLDDLVMTAGNDSYRADRDLQGRVTVNMTADYGCVMDWLICHSDCAEVRKPDKAKAEMIRRLNAGITKYCA